MIDTSHEQPARILIIDDNPDIHKDFDSILGQKKDNRHIDSLEEELFGTTQKPETKSMNYELAFADQGDTGAGMIRDAVDQGTPFQLAFVDMRMPPGWNGLKTIGEIWKIDPRIEIVLCTAYSDYSWEEITRTLGKTQNLLILKKPYDIVEVSQLASALTDKWRLAREAETKKEALEALVEKRTQALNERNQALKIANEALEIEIAERIEVEHEKEKLIAELKRALDKVKTLKGLLPICANCKKIKDDKGYWTKIEQYIEKRSEAEFSHGVCPECAKKLYGHEPWFDKLKDRFK